MPDKGESKQGEVWERGRTDFEGSLRVLADVEGEDAILLRIVGVVGEEALIQHDGELGDCVVVGVPGEGELVVLVDFVVLAVVDDLCELARCDLIPPFEFLVANGLDDGGDVLLGFLGVREDGEADVVLLDGVDDEMADVMNVGVAEVLLALVDGDVVNFGSDPVADVATALPVGTVPAGEMHEAASKVVPTSLGS